MHSMRVRISRIIPLLRPLRPPNALERSSAPRFFNNRSPRRLIAQDGPRPQLPFLFARLGGRHGIFATRPISTETKDFIKYQIKLGAYWTAMLWVIAGGAGIGYMWLRQDWLDKQFPCPPEWDVTIKQLWRAVHHQIETEGFGKGKPNYTRLGSECRELLERLQRGWTLYKDLFGGEVEPLPTNADWDTTIPGIDVDDIQKHPEESFFGHKRIGPDISDKPEHWRRAHFEASMILAKSSEMTYGSLRDNKSAVSFPKEYVKGPSNPYPKPLPPTRVKIEVPLEENCEPLFADPEVFYIRILTTKGYNNSQRIAAGLAYAAWLDFLGDSSLANSMHHWALGNAISGLPTNVEPKSIVNSKTGVIVSESPFVTPNILASSTQIATHHARNGDTTLALNIYVSVLQAMRKAPEAPANSYYPRQKPDLSLRSLESFLKFLGSLAVKSEMPPPPPSGDQPFLRKAADRCEEAGLMTYVGEIMFAAGKARRKDGLSWTREAVGAAEQGRKDDKLDEQSKKKCTQCLEAGMENWSRMAAAFASEQRGAELDGKLPEKASSWWFWGSNGSVEGVDRNWAEEEDMVKERLRRLRLERLDKMLSAQISYNSSWFVV